MIVSLDLLNCDHNSPSEALEIKLPGEQAAVHVKTINDSIQSGNDYFMS